MNTRPNKDFISPDPNPAEEAMLREEGLPDEPPEMTQSEQEAWLATKVWLIARLAWARSGKGANAQVTRYRIIEAILNLKYKDVEILAELKSKGIPRESARHHLSDYNFEFRKLRKS